MKLAVEMGTIGDGSVEAAIRYCQDLEIEGISVPWGRVPGFKEKGHLEADRVGAFRAQIEDAGIACAPMVAWVPPAITAGDAEAEVLFDDLRRSMEAMAEVGADTLMAFPPLRQKPPWEQLVGFYRKFVGLAEQYEIRIATHTMGVLSTYEALTRLMQDAPSAYNGVCLCTGNVWHGDGEKLYDSIRKLGDKIFFVHIRDVKTGMGEKEFWLDKGDIDIPRVLQVLKEIGYDGFLRSEHLPTDRYGRHVPTLSGVSDVGSAWSTGYLRALV
ncbi:MAG TPA: TIM barrel protein [Anaerolineae bacterium]|nr:TIM barrel protein [Anaerolineae bacterium]